MQRGEDAVRPEGEDLVPRGQDAELVRPDRLRAKRRPGCGEEVQQATVAVGRHRAVQRVHQRPENVPAERQRDGDRVPVRGVPDPEIVGEELRLERGPKLPADESGCRRVGRVVPRHELLRFPVRASGSYDDGRRSRADVGHREDEFVGVHVQEARRGQPKEEQFEPIDRAEEEVHLEIERIGDPREGDDNDRRAHRRPARNQVPRLDTVASGKRVLRARNKRARRIRTSYALSTGVAKDEHSGQVGLAKFLGEQRKHGQRASEERRFFQDARPPNTLQVLARVQEEESDRVRHVLVQFLLDRRRENCLARRHRHLHAAALRASQEPGEHLQPDAKRLQFRVRVGRQLARGIAREQAEGGAEEGEDGLRRLGQRLGREQLAEQHIPRLQPACLPRPLGTLHHFVREIVLIDGEQLSAAIPDHRQPDQRLQPGEGVGRLPEKRFPDTSETVETIEQHGHQLQHLLDSHLGLTGERRVAVPTGAQTAERGGHKSQEHSGER